MKSKNIVIFGVVLIMLIVLTGCGNNKNSNEVKEQQETSSNKSQVLADVVEIGDYVNYDAKTEKEHSYEHFNMGEQNSTFSSNDNMSWRVLSVDKSNGTIELFCITSTVAQMNSVYAKEDLNKIAAVYGYGDGAESSRSITLEDIKKYANYDENDNSVCKISVNFAYGQTNTYSLNSDITYPIEDENGKIINVLKSGEQSIQQTFYVIDDLNNHIDNDKISQMLTSSKNGYWLASTCYNLREEGFSIICRCISKKGLLGGGTTQFDDGKWHNHLDCSVGVIVTLKSNIKTSGKDDNEVWQIEK